MGTDMMDGHYFTDEALNWVCRDCGSMVGGWHKNIHDAWHDRMIGGLNNESRHDV